jgi:dihydroneopterin aldolase
MSSDKIQLNGMRFYGFHGVDAAEQSLGQVFVVDVEILCDLGTSAISDDISDTINYSEVYALVRDIVQGTPQNLIERVAHNIAERVLGDFCAAAVRVNVKKPNVSIQNGILDHAGVEIFCERKI